MNTMYDNNETMIKVDNVRKTFGKKGGVITQVLDGAELEVKRGEFVSLMGASGSGKSTLLNCIGGLEIPDSGSIRVDDRELCGMKADVLAEYRREYLGFIFQFYNLVPNLTVRENIQVCQYLSKAPLSLDELLDILGLTEHQKKFPSFL